MRKTVWYKDATVYALYIKAFKDSNSDGYGDINGLISKLDYLQFLGINCILLLPIYQSPEKDNGYDVESHYDINSYLGSLEDFKELLNQAHLKNMQVVIEMVLNHTSNTHKWFLEAAKGSDNPYHEYYIWSDTTDKFKEAKVIYEEYKQSNWTYHPECKKYYFHRYHNFEPDLNYNNPKVRQEIKDVLKHWLDIGVDGFMFDSVSYLFKREGTNCENLPETHVFIKEIRTMMDENYEGKIITGIVNIVIGDKYKYFGKGREFHALSTLATMATLFTDMQQENWQTTTNFTNNIPAILDEYIWFSFCGAHNTLRLDMLTEEDREIISLAYRKPYLQKEKFIIKSRIAPHFDNKQSKIELMYALLFGTYSIPVIYYGDEIGLGDNTYLKNSINSPMQWDDSMNAGFSDCLPSRLYKPVITDPEYHYSTVNVEVQKNKPKSTFNFIKKLLACRNKYKAFKRGGYLRLPFIKKEVVTFMRNYEDEMILVLGNLSGEIQHLEIDLSDYSGMRLLDIFNDVTFSQISETPCRVTLDPYGFYYLKFIDVEWPDDE